MSLPSRPNRDGTIVTFYSFKGGVGRSMAIANIGALLVRRGLRVLCVDFDLEAPGLDRYFEERTTRKSSVGLLDLLTQAQSGESPQFRDFVSEVDVGGQSVLDLITCGKQDASYAQRVLDFNWRQFFEQRSGGRFFESLREAWRTAYDFVLIDSRTGLTDSGGVCTVQLPDILVAVLTTNEQSLEGTRAVVLSAQEARQELAYDRARLVVLPLNSRYDGRVEHDRGRKWILKFEDRLGPFLADWLPKQYRASQLFERVKVPYVAYFSFGENLPVLTQGTGDPESIGFAFDVVARLIEKRFSNADEVLGTALAEPIGAVVDKKAPTRLLLGLSVLILLGTTSVGIWWTARIRLATCMSAVALREGDLRSAQAERDKDRDEFDRAREDLESQARGVRAQLEKKDSEFEEAYRREPPNIQLLRAQLGNLRAQLGVLSSEGRNCARDLAAERVRFNSCYSRESDCAADLRTYVLKFSACDANLTHCLGSSQNAK